MIDIGRVCVKIAGRDAGKKCVVVEISDKNFVLIDGETRRRKCNIIHLEPLSQTVDIKKSAAHSEVVSAFKKLGIELTEKKSKKKTVRPRILRRSKLAKASSAAKSEKPAVKSLKAETKIDATVVKEEKTAEKPKVSLVKKTAEMK